MITLYTSKTCGQCLSVKRFLAIKGLLYDEISVDDIDVAVQLQIKSGLVGAPIVEIDGQFIKGYNPRWIMETIHATSMKA